MSQKIPPYNQAAEEALLGAAFLDEDVARMLVEQVEPEDLFLPRHIAICQAIRNVWVDGGKIDVVTVAENLRSIGQIANVGGPNALETLKEGVQSIASASNYVKIILDHAVRRRVIAASLEAGEEAHDLSIPLTNLLDNLHVRHSNLDVPITETEPDENIDSFLLGSEDYDWVVEGLLERKDRLLITGGEGSGKALALDTKIPTPFGWTTMSELKRGSLVYGPRGEYVEVLEIGEIMEDRLCYKVIFDDGTRITADADHQWPIIDPTDPKKVLLLNTKTLSDMPAQDRLVPSYDFRCPSGRRNSHYKRRLMGSGEKTLRKISAVLECLSEPVKCIQVDSKEGIYLAGQGCVPTHNSTLLRQIAVCLSGGIHPFAFHELDRPSKVLIVDVENSPRQILRSIRPMWRRLPHNDLDINPDNLRIHARPQGLDLLQRSDVRWLTERLEANRPDILVMGPLYKLYGAESKDEGAATKVAMMLDRLRTKYGFVLILETHSPYTLGEGGKRLARPIGSSLWSRWPEFGYGLVPLSDDDRSRMRFTAWRGPRDEREFPVRLKRGNWHENDWPWLADDPNVHIVDWKRGSGPPPKTGTDYRL